MSGAGAAEADGGAGRRPTMGGVSRPTAMGRAPAQAPHHAGGIKSGPIPARDRGWRTMMERAAFAALATSCTPALAHVAPWSGPDPPPPVQFLISIALMAVCGAVIVWQGAALAREALARERERRRASLAGNHSGAASL